MDNWSWGRDLGIIVAGAGIIFVSLMWPPVMLAAAAAGLLLLFAWKAPSRLAVAAICVALAAAAGVGVRLFPGKAQAYTELRYIAAGLALLVAACYLPRVLNGLGRELWLIVLAVTGLLALSWVKTATVSGRSRASISTTPGANSLCG